jgi:hypothetical protein
MNLLSETALWITESEFVTPDGVITRSKGETKVEVQDKTIFNNSWVEFDSTKRVNNYKISILHENEYHYESSNPELGIQIGKFNIDRNVIYSKFCVKGTKLNGFEVITRNGNECIAFGILYEEEDVINTWKAIMKKKVRKKEMKSKSHIHNSPCG